MAACPPVVREVIAASWQRRAKTGGPGQWLTVFTVPAIVAARERLGTAVRDAAGWRGA